jgi:Na+/H+ antiporter NhaD/arsenite permease-like protein
VLFLILLVGNTAGVLTPIGNPPLLAGCCAACRCCGRRRI